MTVPHLLVTGATGKVGSTCIAALLADPARTDWKIRALCHHRSLPTSDRLDVVKGSIADREVCRTAMAGITHVLHLATCKEIPEDVMDVTVKGLFWLLEEARTSPTFKQFILIGGDAGMGHFVYPHPIPVTETQKHSAYPGCYALSKVLEEVMIEQFHIQYGLNACTLRAPWIMEKDDFRYTLTFGEDVFGGPKWHEFVTPEQAKAYAAAGTVPVMLDPAGQPVQRNFVHVDDLAAAINAALDHPKAAGQTYNICMDEPVHYRQVAEYLARTRGLQSVDVPTPFHSTWLDNSKAKFHLGWRPQVDLATLIDRSWNYQRPADQPRKIWYPG
jgi:nucleoside-diphosphate-sugar epimerase